MADPDTVSSASTSDASGHMGKSPFVLSSPHTVALGDYGDMLDYNFDPDENIETEQMYLPGSHRFYPVQIGDELDGGNYRIEHKLGHGGFSTVWMAYDVKREQRVALKIMASGDTGDAAAEREISMQNHIADSVRNVEGASTDSLLTYLGSFSIPGDPETGVAHHVLVFPLRGPSLDSWMDIRKLPPLHLRMTAAWQLLKALERLHDSGIVHRDLNDVNVMWGINNNELDISTTDMVYEYVGRPQKNAITGPHVDQKRSTQAKEHESSPWTWRVGGGERVLPMEVPDGLLQRTIYLGDFGMSIKAETSVQYKPQWPATFCAPERLHNQDPSFASDMWSYTCIFAQLFLGLMPFRGPSIVQLLTDLVGCLGPLPEEWRGNFNVADPEEGPEADDFTGYESWYDPSTKRAPSMTLEALVNRLAKTSGFSAVHGEYALSVMGRGFCYLPESRITAKELLQDPSFLAIMRLYEVDMS